VTKRGKCAGKNSKISWTQVETGSAITWKYPSCILQGDNSIGEFYSVALTNHAQQADTGTKMIPSRQEHALDDHLEGHCRQGSQTTVIAVLVKVMPKAKAPQLHAV
jgi:Fe-S cluster assembly protein SufB